MGDISIVRIVSPGLYIVSCPRCLDVYFVRDINEFDDSFEVACNRGVFNAQSFGRRDSLLEGFPVAEGF